MKENGSPSFLGNDDEERRNGASTSMMGFGMSGSPEAHHPRPHDGRSPPAAAAASSQSSRSMANDGLPRPHGISSPSSCSEEEVSPPSRFGGDGALMQPTATAWTSRDSHSSVPQLEAREGM